MRERSSQFDLAYWREVDRQGTFPQEYWESLAKSGFFGIISEKRYGGMEKGMLDFALAVEQTAEQYAGLGSYLFLSGALVSKIFLINGTASQKDELLPLLSKGGLKISIALTEERAGFDATALETRATRVENGNYALTGSKIFVNNADLADYLVVFARTTDSDKVARKSEGVSMFLVNAHDPAIRKKKLDRLGMNFVNSFSLEFHNLELDEGSLIGEAGKAWYNIIDIFNMDRILTAASLVGTAKRALSLAAQRVRERVVFGKPVGSYQGIQFPLADAAARVEVAEALTLKAAALADQLKNFSNDAAYALFSASNAAAEATDRALQAFGGHGYYKDYDVERFWRDVRAHKLHPISHELLLASISERALSLPKSY